MTDDLDAYYMHIHGARTAAAEKPRQEIAEPLRALVRQLDDVRPPGWLTTSLRILDGDSEVRTFIADNLMRLQNACNADGELHDLSYTFTRKPAAGVTVMAAPASRIDELHQQLNVYGPLKKYQTRSDEWFAVGVIADGDLQLASRGHSREPWRYDPEAEASLRALPMRKMAQIVAAPVNCERTSRRRCSTL